jgi:glutathione S-transferase
MATANPPALKLHMLRISHPCLTAVAALEHKGLPYELIELSPGEHNARMEEVYGPGHTTVPGLLVGDEPVHGSVAILRRLEELRSSPPLYPEATADAVREAEEWADGELQDLGRRLPWGALRFRPEAMGTYGGGEQLDPAGVDFAFRLLHQTWKYHRITAARLAEDLLKLPALLDRVDSLAAAGTIGGDEPNAADLQIGATVRVLLTVEDLHPLLENRAAAEIARRWFADYPGRIPAGAYPPGWVPAAAP